MKFFGFGHQQQHQQQQYGDDQGAQAYWQVQQAQSSFTVQHSQPSFTVQGSQPSAKLATLVSNRDQLIEKFCTSVEDIITREPSFEESVTVLSHLFPNQLLTADNVSPHVSFTDQGRCQAVNKRGKKQCANKCMNNSRFCRTHHDIAVFPE